MDTDTASSTTVAKGNCVTMETPTAKETDPQKPSSMEATQEISGSKETDPMMRRETTETDSSTQPQHLIPTIKETSFMLPPSAPASGKSSWSPASGTPTVSNPQSKASSADPLEVRDTWKRKFDFLFACVGFSIGLGNIWRFPYLCYKNGGGAFLIPYFLCVIVGGIPMFFLEVAIGQFMSQGGIMVWNICPLFQGIGVATTIIVFLLNVYYNVILAWTLYYLFASFTSVLPWSHCNNEWNTEFCHVSTSDSNASIFNNFTSASNETRPVHYTDPVTEFWEHKVLHISASIEEAGTIKWDLALCLLLAWIIIYFCIWKGIKSSGKVMYFTAPAPYFFMAALLIRGLTLPGAMDGLKFYLLPDWSKLADTQVWVDAGTQIFFSYSIGIGTLTALGSYNKYNHNSYRDCMIFACTNSGTSFFAGFVIFSVLGFMAHEQGVDVGAVAESGPGLAFIAYPKAVAQMPFPPLWSILFFLMILLLGLDSQFVGMEGFVTAIVDLFPHQLRKGHRKELFILAACAVAFLIGLSMVTHSGVYVFQLFDYYSGSRIILLVAFFECLAVAYIYGVRRFHDNLKSMYGFRISPIMQICWTCVTPFFTLIIFTLCIYSYSELTYNRVYHYPNWAIGLGWGMACSSVTMIPIVAIGKIIITKGSLRQRIRTLIRPRLRFHQLRPDDDPKDLINYFVDNDDSDTP